MRFKYIIISLLSLIAPISLFGQSINDAKRLYQEKNYVEAKPILEEVYSSSPNNSEANNMLGVIAFEEGEYLKARKYLELASQKRVTESYLYLGRLYSLLYMFDDAEKEFVKYEKANRRNKVALENLENEREVANKLQRMVNRTENIQIIDSIVVPKSDFLVAYKLSASSGSLQPVNQFFKNQITNDKVLFTNERRDKIYYSLEDSINGSKLYSMEKLLDDFGNEKPLFEVSSHSGNQAYPFVMTDGVTIYFASTGNESIGGYDIFVTRYNYNTSTYLAPNQLNMPFNSPFNDYMMVIDDEKGIGWFASDRFQPDGYVCVYTFIPSQRIVLIDSDNEEYIAGRAMISSIKDSWDSAIDYSDLIELSKRDNNIEISKSAGDFEFIINDQVTYHTLSDFKHGAAKTLFSQSLELEKNLSQMIIKLDGLREQYANGAKNQEIRTAILNLENSVNTTKREVESLKLRARNEEIRNTF